MTQPHYYTRHHGTEAPCGRLTSNSRSPATRDLASITEPGQQGDDVFTLRFLAARKLRQLDVEGPWPMSLALNGQPLCMVQPGRNNFEPPIPLNPGDVLQLQVLDSEAGAGTQALSGWNRPATGSLKPRRSQEGRH